MCVNEICIKMESKFDTVKMYNIYIEKVWPFPNHRYDWNWFFSTIYVFICVEFQLGWTKTTKHKPKTNTFIRIFCRLCLFTVCFATTLNVSMGYNRLIQLNSWVWLSLTTVVRLCFCLRLLPLTFFTLFTPLIRPHSFALSVTFMRAFCTFCSVLSVIWFTC